TLSGYGTRVSGHRIVGYRCRLHAIGPEFPYLIHLTANRILVGHRKYFIVRKPLLERYITELGMIREFVRCKFARVLELGVIPTLAHCNVKARRSRNNLAYVLVQK